MIFNRYKNQTLIQGTGEARRKQIIDLITADIPKDLHIHTCYSDGTLTPAQIVDRWQSEGYKMIAITDHDGIEGSMIGMDHALGMDITFVQGIEFDSCDEIGKDLHMLGYGFDYNNEKLREVLHDVIIKRARRNDRLMNALNRLGYGITLDDIGAINEGRYIGKPTFALILKLKGFVEQSNDAFNTIFRHESIREIQKETLSTKEVIDVIHEAEGVAVLAHPMEQRHMEESWEDFKPRLYKILDKMTEYGIDGIECYHPSADSTQSELLKEYAEAHGLIITKGSDFHTDIDKRNFSRYHI